MEVVVRERVRKRVEPREHGLAFGAPDLVELEIAAEKARREPLLVRQPAREARPAPGRGAARRRRTAPESTVAARDVLEPDRHRAVLPLEGAE